jgi:hypothetical protein
MSKSLNPFIRCSQCIQASPALRGARRLSRAIPARSVPPKAYCVKNIEIVKFKKLNIEKSNYSVSTNLFARTFMTWGRVVYSMSSMGSLPGSNGPCALM